jgi:parvulin-like peptidyl-prolyl isomerase
MIKSIIAVLLFLIPCNVMAQSAEEIIATVGNQKITVKEYKTRFELMPRLSKYFFNIDSLKNEFIYSLISEKLWSMESEARGYDKSAYFKLSFAPLEKIYLKDALYKHEVDNKIVITGEEINKGVIRSKYTLKAGIFSTLDSSEVFHVYEKIKNDQPIDTSRFAEAEITYGSMDDAAIEDVIYSLGKGEFSAPFKYKAGWFIFHLRDGVFYFDGDNDALISKVRQNLRERKARETGTKFLSVFLKDVTADADTSLFRFLAVEISEELKDKTPDEFEKKEQTLFLSEESVRDIELRTPKEKLKLPFISINSKSTSFGEFLSFLRFDIFSAKSAEPATVMGSLKRKIDYYIEQELLSEEARRRNLHLTAEYQEELRLWRENYLAHMLRTDFIKDLSVNDQEVYEFYLELSNRIDSVASLNILEILTDDLVTIETVLNELNEGADFRELAKLNTKREWTKESGGEFGLFPVTLFREISEHAVNLNVGDVYGPIKIQEGYSIFKLIEKKEPVRLYRENYDTVKDQLRNDLLVRKFKDIIEEETLKLAEKFQFKINNDLLRRTPVSEITMFTHRYMGFGGRITAVPYTMPWHEWKSKVDFKEL